MEKFQFYSPTNIIFGEGAVQHLAEQLNDHKKILLHYGGGSIKRSGLYDEVMEILNKAGIGVVELGGVEPNPKLDMVRKGIELCQKEDVSFILAVGGGSVADSAKAIAAGFLCGGDVWECFVGEREYENALPVGVILTIPATGSETSDASVITNEDGLYKRSIGNDNLRPVFAIMDPELTLTLPDVQTFAGVVDIYSHVHERYFTHTNNVSLTDNLCEATFKTVIENAYRLKEDTQDLAARAEIMLTGTIAHNGILGLGREEDWGSHRIGHEFSALYGTTHGISLAMIIPAWMKYVYKEDVDRFARYAVNVFGVPTEGKTQDEIALEGIDEFVKFLKRIDMPSTLSEGGYDDKDFDLIAEKCTQSGPVGSFKKLYKDDVLAILEIAK